MATFPFINADRLGGRSRPRTALLLPALLLSGASFLQAGNVITLTNGTEIDGKLSLSGAAIHAESVASPPDTQLTDVLEATFAEAPFQLNFFSAGDTNQFPSDWTSQNIGDVSSPGSASLQGGVFTVIGSTADMKKKGPADRLFFVGTPWPVDGQFTARLVSMDLSGWAGLAGLQLRDSLDPKAQLCGAELTPQGQIRLPFHHGNHREEAEMLSAPVEPLWLRFTRVGTTVFTSLSSDGKDWDIIAESPFETLTNPLVGLMAATMADKKPPKAVFDNVSITPLPSSAQVLQAGVLLQGGSLLVGRVSRLNLDPTAEDDNGELLRGTEHVPLSRSAIAAVFTLPIERSQLAQYDSKPGLLMRNGDTMDGDVTEIGLDQISVSSVLLGLSTYKPTEVRACFLAPLQDKPAPFEVRLRDGSILNATAVTGDGSAVTITDASGLTIQVKMDELAQIRAGTAVVQDMAQLDWKANGPGAPAPPPTPAPANNGAPAAPPAAEPAPPLVNSWLGPDQQQVLEAGADTAIDFPLPGKFRAMGVQVALSSDSPPNATATIRILADGREVAKSPPFHAGGPPRFMELAVPNATHLTLQAESTFPGIKLLYLDPVAIR